MATGLSAYKKQLAAQKERRAEVRRKHAAEKAAKKEARAAKKLAKQKAKNLKKLKKMPLGSVSISPTGQGKLSPTGKIRRGAKGAVVTEGGAYAKYDKKSKAAKSFSKAFAEASDKGNKTFTWDGRSYTTEKASAKKAPAKKAPAKKVATKKAPAKKVAKSKATGFGDVTDIVKNIAASEKAKAEEAKTKKAPKIKPWKAPKDKYRTKTEKKQYGGRVSTPPAAPAGIPRGRTPRPVSPVGSDRGPMAPRPSYEEGGEVEANNPYGWPTRDARNGGKK